MQGKREFPRALDGTYLNTPAQWRELAKQARKAGVVGLDTEFYGLDVRKQSCVGRARVHVWSLAIRTARQSPLGFARARGWVLPAEALLDPALRTVLEDASITKAVHNQPVDDHAIHNHGVLLRGCVNTLGLARWAWPELITEGGFGLKNLMFVKLRRDPVAEYEDVVSDEREINVERLRKFKETRCECGEPKCRLRKARENHMGVLITHTKEVNAGTRVEWIPKVEKYQHPLESIVPGHKRWDLLVRYAAEDAVAALEILELAEAEEDPAPYPYEMVGGYVIPPERPEFRQDIEDQVVLMERTGFRIDTAYCESQAIKAEADEAKELRWLRKWFRANEIFVVEENDCELQSDEQIDAIWSSPKRLGVLFDALGFPSSPVWKKGKVKPGETKLDGAALEWIARNCEGAKQLIKHILHLKRIRSGKKYLVKMRDCGGWVNPICGPAGDKDDRNGAVTGRLGIKGVLEAQQLPSREEADLYQIRKAVVA